MRKNIYYRLRRYFGLRYITIISLYHEYKAIVNQLGSSSDLYENQAKLKSRIIMNAHSIEKGLSLKNIRLGYGKLKIIALSKDVTHYYEKFNDKDMVIFVSSIIDSYLAFNKERGVEDKDILEAHSKLIKILDDNNLADTVYLHGGYFNTTREKIHQYGKIDYLNFVKNRHSIRNFTGNAIDIDLIKRALQIAEYTPSACNRQPWANHIFLEKSKINQILDFQTGAKQFKEDLSCVILVTGKYSSFFGSEYHQPFVNGGMYAMNLIFALHSLGLGTTPLNMGFSPKKLKQLSHICDIKPDEAPVVLIGVGEISETIQIATSSRFNNSEYTKFY